MIKQRQAEIIKETHDRMALENGGVLLLTMPQFLITDFS